MGKLLQLPSQRQLVDRLLHQIEFNHPFIFLSGRPGSGRGTLCESLQGRLPEAVRVANLIGNGAMSMADVRQLLLRQVVDKPLFNPQDPLAESFFRMLEGRSANLLLLIERADELPADLVGELWALCRHNDSLATPHKLAILLSGSGPWCLEQKAGLKGRALPALELEVGPLSPPEQRIFLYEKANELKIPTLFLPRTKVEEILNMASGHPSTIMQLLEKIVTDRRIRKHQVELGVRKIATVAAAVAAGLLVLSYLPLFDDEGKEVAQAPSQGMTLPNAASGALPVSAAQPTDGKSAGGEQVAQEWQADTKPLPKVVEGETITADAGHYEGRRVVIEGDVVEKLMTEPQVSGALPTAVVEELTAGSSQATSTAPKASQPVATPQSTASTEPKAAAPKAAETKAAPIPAPAKSTAAAATPVTRVTLTPAVTLNKKAASHYSIQLMGASTLPAISKFVAENGLAGKVWTYETRFRGSPWYVVIQGDYANGADAKAAIRKLSPALLKGQPWPKSFAQIQKELKQ